MRTRHLLAFATVLVACFGCDQASKQVAQSLLADAGRVSLAGDAVRFQLTSNLGGFLGLGSTLPQAARSLLLVWFVPSVLALLFVHFLRSAHTARSEWIALGLLAGGGLGNWLDRVLNGGAVTDFVSLGVGPLRTGIFNVADLAVVAGVLLLVLAARGRPESAPPASA
jgi:signal peptidase II